ncbi:PKD domain-containing protein [archaeon]|nr:MAG: PKD domain-containing protein [archaeon]
MYMVEKKAGTWHIMAAMLATLLFLSPFTQLQADPVLTYSDAYSVVDDTVVLELYNHGYLVTATVTVHYSYQCEPVPEYHVSSVTDTFDVEGPFQLAVPVTDPANPALCWSGPVVDDVEIDIISYEIPEETPNEPPVATITAAIPESGYVPLQVMFQATIEDDGTGLTWRWDFDDGTTVSGEGPQSLVFHTYQSSGPYLVFFTAWDDENASSYAFVKVNVYDPRADITGDIIVGGTLMAGSAVTFDASALFDHDEPIARYSWAFGDGTSASGIYVEHAYDDVGEYDVTLSMHYIDTSVRTLSTSVSIIENKPPTATFEIEGMKKVDEPIVYDASASTDPEGMPLSYHWDFGDGTTASGMTSTHAYELPGPYTVTLAVSDGHNTVSVTRTAEVSVNSAPVASFETSGATEVDSKITFDGTSSHDPDGDALSYHWDFGDGTKKEGAVVTYAYEVPGTYTATLEVSDSLLTSSTQQTMTICEAGMPIWIYIIPLLAVGALVAVMLWRRQQRLFDTITLTKKER